MPSYIASSSQILCAICALSFFFLSCESPTPEQRQDETASARAATPEEEPAEYEDFAPPSQQDATLVAELEYACDTAQNILQASEDDNESDIRAEWLKRVLAADKSDDFHGLVVALETRPVGLQHQSFIDAMELSGGPADWQCEALRAIFPSTDDVQAVYDADCTTLQQILAETNEGDERWQRVVEASETHNPLSLLFRDIGLYRQHLVLASDRPEIVEEMRSLNANRLQTYSYLEPCEAYGALLDDIE